MLRDKDYLITTDTLIFNAIGYDHPPGRTTANLKYVRGKKWTDGYAAALQFLESEYPQYVDGVVSIPESYVRLVHHQRDGLRRIRQRAVRNRLEQAAIDLTSACAEFFAIAPDRFGVTDSLLWGRGGDQSDVDLVVYGSDAAAGVLARLPALWSRRGFQRLNVDNFTRSAGPRADELGEQCRRKLNKGLYRGVRFSLRAVREDSDIESFGPFHAVGPTEIKARVVDNAQSLFFPATYKLDCGLDAVSFLVRHEAAFGVGETLVIRGTMEQGRRSRVVIGGLNGRDDRMEATTASRSAVDPTTSYAKARCNRSG